MLPNYTLNDYRNDYKFKTPDFKHATTYVRTGLNYKIKTCFYKTDSN